MSEIAFCICGSFCNHKKTLAVLEQLVAAGYAVTPVLSENAVSFDTRFGRAADFVNSVETLTGREIIYFLLLILLFPLVHLEDC